MERNMVMHNVSVINMTQLNIPGAADNAIHNSF